MGIGEGDLTSDDLQEHENDCSIRDKAIRWITEHRKEIEGLAGREGAAAEKALAQLIIVVELAASMYTGLRKEHGHPAAQETLRSAITLIGGILRRNGEDVLMTATVNFQPLSQAPGGPDVAGAAAPPESCACDVDQDGHCPSCIATLERFNSTMAQAIVIMKDADLSGKVVCRPCFRREMDPVMARFVRNEISKLDSATAESLMKSMFQASQSMQALKMPLTTKAWDELIKSRP